MIEAIAAAIVALLGAFFFGARHARKKQDEAKFKRNVDAHERARRTKDEVVSLDNDAVLDRLRKRSGR